MISIIMKQNHKMFTHPSNPIPMKKMYFLFLVSVLYTFNLAAQSDCTGFAYVTNFDGNTVSVIDITSQTVTDTIPVGAYPLAVAFTTAGDTALVVNVNGNSISVVNTTTHTVTHTIAGFAGPLGIVRYPASNTFYVANLGSNTIHIVTPTDGIIGTIPLSGGSW